MLLAYIALLLTITLDTEFQLVERYKILLNDLTNSKLGMCTNTSYIVNLVAIPKTYSLGQSPYEHKQINDTDTKTILPKIRQNLCNKREYFECLKSVRNFLIRNKIYNDTNTYWYILNIDSVIDRTPDIMSIFDNENVIKKFDNKTMWTEISTVLAMLLMTYLAVQYNAPPYAKSAICMTFYLVCFLMMVVVGFEIGFYANKIIDLDGDFSNGTVIYGSVTDKINENDYLPIGRTGTYICTNTFDCLSQMLAILYYPSFNYIVINQIDTNNAYQPKSLRLFDTWAIVFLISMIYFGYQVIISMLEYNEVINRNKTIAPIIELNQNTDIKKNDLTSKTNKSIQNFVKINQNPIKAEVKDKIIKTPAQSEQNSQKLKLSVAPIKKDEHKKQLDNKVSQKIGLYVTPKNRSQFTNKLESNLNKLESNPNKLESNLNKQEFNKVNNNRRRNSNNNKKNQTTHITGVKAINKNWRSK